VFFERDLTMSCLINLAVPMNQINQFLIWHGGLLLFLAAFAEQSGVPIPAVPLLLAAGALAADGQLNLISAIAGTTMACILADALWFYAGHRGKTRLLSFFGRWHDTRLARPRTGLRATLRGIRILTAAKFFPLGTLVPLRAGSLHIVPMRFLLLDVPGSLIYASVYLLLGFFFHQQLHQLTAIVRGLGMIGLPLVVLLTGIYAACVFVRRHRIKQNPANSLEVKMSDASAQPQTPAPIKN
jgi:membrane protein DedA with SNARE-associated domain